MADGEAAAGTVRRDLEEEFNMQRARMKELFLQKEGSYPQSRMD